MTGAERNPNDFSEARKSPRPPNRTGTVMKVYGVALIVALVFFICGHHVVSYCIQIGTYVALVAWLVISERGQR
jgi:hypothetical protein